MGTTIGEINAMLRRLPALRAEDAMQAADVAFIAAAPAESRQPWWDRLLRVIRGEQAHTTTGQPESVASIRARKMAERERAAGQ